MTIRQLLLASADSGAAPASAISYKGRDSAYATTITIPTHATGDLIVIAARGTASVPSGWTEIRDSSYQWGTAIVVGYKLAASDSEISGTWTGAGELHVGVYDGVSSIGASAEWAGTNITTWPALTLTQTDGSSLVIGVGFDSTTAPSGMTKRGTGSRITLCDTAAGTSSWTAKTTFTPASYSAAFTFELVSE